MSVAHPVVRVLILCLVSAALLPLGIIGRASASAVDHLVVSELMTGGTGASDELIELYNPSASPLPLEVSSSSTSLPAARR